jgi:hypothetical protein
MNRAERRAAAAQSRSHLRRAEKIKQKIERECGTCTACCRLMGVEEFDKPDGQWCQHCAIGAGCRIYEDRPPSCRNWSCMWRQFPNLLPQEELRPDRCGFVIYATRDDQGVLLVIIVDYGDPCDELTWPPLLRPWLDQMAPRDTPILVKFVDDGGFLTSEIEEHMRRLWPDSFVIGEAKVA